jgi:hypothetical protein
MQLQLHPTITLTQGTFNILIAPPQMLTESLNTHPKLQRFKLLYIQSNHSRILSSLDRRFTELDIRRAFTAFQLLTILKENHHTLVLIEYDPTLYEDSTELLDYISLAMREAAKRSIVLLYAPKMDPYLEEISDKADRVFYFEQGEVQRPSKRKGKHWQNSTVGEQKTLEAF